MKLYLMRHGDSAPDAIDDKRVLSERGIKEVEAVADFIKPLNISVSYILQSKKIRAQQTAAIISSSIRSLQPIETRSELDPNANVEFLFSELVHQGEDALLVGHMPYLGLLASYLISGKESEDVILFHTGTLCCFRQFASNRWVIEWVIPPILS